MQTANEAPQQPTGKGARAYDLRKTTGDTWDKIADRVGSTSPEAAVAGAKKFAKTRDLPWPIRTAKDIAKEKAEEDAERARAKRDARVYERVKAGTPVMEIMGMTPTNVYRAIDRHVERTGDPPLPRNSERAYKLRRKGMVWAKVAHKLRYERESTAIEAARRHAQDHDLPWPPDVEAKKDPRRYVGYKPYHAVEDGQSWEDQAEELGKSVTYVKGRSKTYAEAYDLPWPPTSSQ